MSAHVVQPHYVILPCTSCDRGVRTRDAIDRRGEHVTFETECRLCDGEGEVVRPCDTIVPEAWWRMRNLMETSEWAAWMHKEGVISWELTPTGMMPVMHEQRLGDNELDVAAE